MSGGLSPAPTWSPGEGDFYYCGGAFGGLLQEVLLLAKICRSNFEADAKKGIEAAWQEESHLNRYMWINKPSKVLSPEYLWQDFKSKNPEIHIIRFSGVVKNYAEIRPNGERAQLKNKNEREKWVERLRAFNLDTSFPLIKTAGGDGSLFGLSVALHQDLKTDTYLLLVGAPREKAEPNVPANRTGGVYSCPITTDQSDCTRMNLIGSDIIKLYPEWDVISGHHGNGQSEEFVLMSRHKLQRVTHLRHPVSDKHLPEDLLENMWLGVSVASQGRPGGRVLACGHRFAKIYGTSQLRQMIGRYLLSQYRGNDLQYDDEDANWQNPEQPCNHHGDVGGEVMCNMGISASITQTEVIVGSPGSYEWQGNVHVSWMNPDDVFDTKKSSFPKLERRNIYIGYSVTQARRLLSQDDETIVTGGGGGLQSDSMNKWYDETPDFCRLTEIVYQSHGFQLKAPDQRTDVVTVTPWLAPVVWEGTFNPVLLDSIYKPQNISIAATVFAVGKYIMFLKNFLETAEQHFFVGFKVHVYVFTDQPKEVPKVKMAAGRDRNERKESSTFTEQLTVRLVPSSKRWQEISARRMKLIQTLIEEELQNHSDYIFCLDVDSQFHGRWGTESLGGLVAVIHPGQQALTPSRN
ncbi:hypothetical protein L3Q82_002582 [Scortum barcoo]|uniref:Uncharacterized protein n=1 Tax=Scortum barcoo TaxID=214431 RepID=A0ACB8VV60_9TELE|nr:hypothetical protein L3Q82_002582 [Scortum barcoo]